MVERSALTYHLTYRCNGYYLTIRSMYEYSGKPVPGMNQERRRKV